MKILSNLLPFETPFSEGAKIYLCKICQNDWTEDECGICHMCQERLNDDELKEYSKEENIEIINGGE